MLPLIHINVFLDGLLIWIEFEQAPEHVKDIRALLIGEIQLILAELEVEALEFRQNVQCVVVYALWII